MSDAMRRLLEERWPLVRDEAHAQLTWLHATVTTDLEHAVGAASEARKVAHQLRGRCGMYGRREASELAGVIEDRLVHAGSGTPAPSAPGTTPAEDTALADELVALIAQLDALLTCEPSLSPSE